MKKPVKLFALFLMAVFHSSCGQNQTNPPQENINSGNFDKLVTTLNLIAEKNK